MHRHGQPDCDVDFLQAVVLCGVSYEKQVEINDWTHQNGVHFISAETCGLSGSVFDDFGPRFTCVDRTGEQRLTTGMIASVEKTPEYVTLYFQRTLALSESRVNWRNRTRRDVTRLILPHARDHNPFFVMQDQNKVYAFINANPDFVAPGNTMELLSYNPIMCHCHVCSNSEIEDLDFWRGEAYSKFFEYLDEQGGFYYERHSCIGAALFAKKEQIHFFNDIMISTVTTPTASFQVRARERPGPSSDEVFFSKLAGDVLIAAQAVAVTTLFRPSESPV
ncbi:glycosyltransferase family 15 protein [Suillus brevipes Sb2]|nr:glycosyltransferase family 15 protein [Suillus brevipes Sb2]